MIVVAGLGPGGPGLIPPVTWDWIGRAAEVHLRTDRHPAARALGDRGVPYSSFDHVYEDSDSLEAAYLRIAGALVDRAAVSSPVLLLVPGSPDVAEETVKILRRQCAERGIELRIEPAPSFLDLVYRALDIDPTDGLQVVDAYRLLAGVTPTPELGLVISQVDSRLLAGDLKLRLLEVFGPDHPALVLRHLGDGDRVEEVTLSLLDHRDDFDHLTCVYIPPESRGGGDVALWSRRFYRVVSALLGEGGCPWDRRQTHRSLRPFMIEECYEAVACMDGGDPDRLAEELGDVLLQVYLHAGIAEGAGEFSMIQVLQAITDKMMRRHPHVFGRVQVQDAEEVLANWETIKREERGQERASLLSGIPAILPALMQAMKVQEKAARVGLDWPDAAGPRDKLAEEIHELESACGPRDREHELGDVLFSVVNWARFIDVVPEVALRAAVRRFARRFAVMEEACRSRGLDLAGMTLKDMDRLWDEAKAEDRQKRGFAAET